MLRVQDVMTETVHTIAPDAAATDAWETMRVNRIHHLVVTEGRQIVGILSDRDTGGRAGAAVRKGKTVADLMTARVVVVPPSTPIRRAANLMRGSAIGCLVVGSRGSAAGIITVSDLLTLLGRGEERPRADAERHSLRHRAPHRKRNASTGAW
jgi:CBS domain-containing protein